MTLHHTADKRARLAELRREIADIEAGKKKARRAASKATRLATKAARAESPMKRQRAPRVRNNAYLAFLRRQPCLNCGKTPSDAAHIRFAPHGSGWRYVGKGEKPDDFRAVPLCRACHTEQHSMSEARYWAEVLERDPVETAAFFMDAFMAQGQKASQTRIASVGGSADSRSEPTTEHNNPTETLGTDPSELKHTVAA